MPDPIDPATDLLILAGVAGGLDPTLAIGDVVIESELPQATLPTARSARVVCAKTLVCTADEKAHLHAESGAAAVDMEADPARALATRIGLPLIIIRAISDTADHALDPDLLRLLDDHGRVRPLAVAAYIIRRPENFRALLRLNANTRIAERCLGQALVQLLRAIVATNVQ